MDSFAQFYYLFFLAAGVAYLGFYVVPLVRALFDLRLSGLDGLVQGVRHDLDTVTAAERPDRPKTPERDFKPPPPVSRGPLTDAEAQDIADAYADGYPVDEIRESYDLTFQEWSELRDRHDFQRGVRTVIGGGSPASEQEDTFDFDLSDTDLDDETEEEQEEITSPQRWAAERLSRLGSLKGSYQGVVQEAVDQIQSQYPDGAYQRFEIERLPTVAAFSERVGAARTMAGLFVLLGLLFTMIRLNDVIELIAASAGNSTMEPAAFLARMGELMEGIGGAFDSSIFGLALLVLALVIVGAIDWVAQGRLLKLERAVTHEVVPPLAQIHDRLSPNLTLADLLAETGAHLDVLGRTVGGLTGELDTSLSLLGDRIGRMMDDFRSFQDQYARLDDLLNHMKSASANLAGTAGALESAARRVGDPLNAFNKTLLSHVETVVDWTAVSKDGFERLTREAAATREHSDRLVEGLARAAQDGFGESLRDHRTAVAAIESQAVRLERRLTALSDAVSALPAGGDGAFPDDPDAA